MLRVRYHQEEAVELLLDWCAEHAAACPDVVTAVGLAYIYGLNEHQIAAATIVERRGPVVIDYPQARRAADIRGAEHTSLALDEPDWLAQAASRLAADALPGALLFRKRRRVNIPMSAGFIRALVADAGRAACGLKMSCTTLNHTRIAAVRKAGFPFALHSLGYTDSWEGQLVAADLAPLMPRKAKTKPKPREAKVG